jgi:hypothetical protein
VLTAYDPWDEERDTSGVFDVRLLLVPHGGLRHGDRVRIAAEHEAPVLAREGASGDPGVWLGGPEVEGPDHVLATAWFRESSKSGEDSPTWAGHEMARRTDGACTHPYVLRLVEWEGRSGEVVVRFPGPASAVARTDLMGEVAPLGGQDAAWLEPEVTGEEGPFGSLSRVRFPIGAREIVTLMVDLVPGRKQWRNLDARRKVWATVHREGRDG